MNLLSESAFAAIAALSSAMAPARANGTDDRAAVARLDIEYQAAVKRNDAETMDRILHPDFVLVLGNGTVVSREQLMEDARRAKTVYEVQDEDEGTQTVRVWGDTAVVTARLRIKGHDEMKDFDRKLWFSDTYVRTLEGWRYAFAQASSPLSQ